MDIISKKQMSEADIIHKYIYPAVVKKWDKGKVVAEKYFTDGRIKIFGNKTKREPGKKADLLLYIERNNPIAVIEAKDNNHSVSHGLQQAMEYAQILNIPFAYSSNGDGFVEHDFLTGMEREFSLENFPTEEELLERIRKVNGLTETQEKIIKQPYYSDLKTHTPRYYQTTAINKTLDAIARGQDRLLLVLATGTGKTYVAFQIIYRLINSGLKKKILYLADRNILVDQSIQQDFAPLEKVIHKIKVSKEDSTTITSYQVYFSLYQQLVGDDDKEHFRDLFKPDFFDFIVIDECHRGSAREDGKWRRILDYFSSATHLGMTATPKESATVSNVTYFGEPIYQYSLNNGIDDGFLAPFRVVKVTTNISDGWRPLKGQTDMSGNEIEDRIYNNVDYDKNIVILDRTKQVAHEITEFLKTTDRMGKTIVFCETEDAAQRMRDQLVRLNSDKVKENPDYIVRITGSDDYGKSKLDYFISVSSPYPVIATTSELLSTGVDCKMTKLIVLDKNISSMTEFKQILGRGTRLREEDGKTFFTVLDFRNITNLFADPAWDGEPEIIIKDPVDKPDIIDGSWDVVEDPDEFGDKNKRDIPVINIDGCKVEIIHKIVSVYDPKGKLLTQESLEDYTKRNIKGKYASLNDFINNWSSEDKKEKIIGFFNEKGIDFEELKKEKNMAEVDDYDFICYMAFNTKPLTRKERANNVKKRDFFSKYSGKAREVLEILLDLYMDNGICDIEERNILTLDPFKKYGKPTIIADFFGGKEEYDKAIKDLESAIYEELV